MSLQLVTPNDYSTMPKLSNATTPQPAHGKTVKSNANPMPEPSPSGSNRVEPVAYSSSATTGNHSIRPDDSSPRLPVTVEEVVPMKMKTCVKCKQQKSVLEFHKNSRSSDGLHSYCKDCNRAQALAHIKEIGRAHV